MGMFMNVFSQLKRVRNSSPIERKFLSAHEHVG